MKEELKQAIDKHFISPLSKLGAEKALQDPSILRHADPEIMKQAGWVREEELNDIIEAAKTALHTLDCIEFTRESGTISNRLQNLIDNHLNNKP